MVTGTMPFKGSTVAALKKSILDGLFELPGDLSDECMDIIKSILKRKASWRLSLEQVTFSINIYLLANLFFAPLPWQNISNFALLF